jgi:hypothetical protein
MATWRRWPMRLTALVLAARSAWMVLLDTLFSLSAYWLASIEGAIGGVHPGGFQRGSGGHQNW